MKKCSIIIQGEGKGHFSQALTTIQILEKKGIKINCVYLGKSFLRRTPDYFHTPLNAPVRSFYSPNFIRNRGQKGIRIILSILLNLVASPIYIFEATRLGIMMIWDKTNCIYNFYDPVGSVACRWWKRRAERIVISHHFYLSHPDFLPPHGMGNSSMLLYIMNRIMSRSADRVFGLSFRRGSSRGKIEVIPPLIDEEIRLARYRAGDRDLCYFLNPGFVIEMLDYYRERPDLSGDIFTDASPAMEIPVNVILHKPSREKFREAMKECKRIICTAGFDTVAEAFYMGIPIFVIPSVNHYEQYCNALDASRTGMAFQLENLTDLDEAEFSPVNNRSYREWTDENPFQ